MLPFLNICFKSIKIIYLSFKTSLLMGYKLRSNKSWYHSCALDLEQSEHCTGIFSNEQTIKILPRTCLDPSFVLFCILISLWEWNENYTAYPYMEILSHKYSIIATSLDRQNKIIKTTCLIISLHTEKAFWYYTKFQHHQVMTSQSINNLWVYPI